jgi:hypothetical protein
MSSPYIPPEVLSDYIGIRSAHPRDFLPTEILKSQTKYAPIFRTKMVDEFRKKDTTLNMVKPVRRAQFVPKPV